MSHLGISSCVTASADAEPRAPARRQGANSASPYRRGRRAWHDEQESPARPRSSTVLVSSSTNSGTQARFATRSRRWLPVIRLRRARAVVKAAATAIATLSVVVFKYRCYVDKQDLRSRSVAVQEYQWYSNRSDGKSEAAACIRDELTVSTRPLGGSQMSHLGNRLARLEGRLKPDDDLVLVPGVPEHLCERYAELRGWDPEELKREWCAPRWVRRSKTDRDVMASLRAKLAALGT
jgi:hypothetical protein